MFRKSEAAAGEGIGLRDTAVHVLPMCFPIAISGKQLFCDSRVSA